VITPSGCAKFKGLGEVNEDGNEYGFMVTACKDGAVTFRIETWQTSDGSIVYDNRGSAKVSYDGTVIVYGDIKSKGKKSIKKGKKKRKKRSKKRLRS
jgi:hypothetical protein